MPITSPTIITNVIADVRLRITHNGFDRKQHRVLGETIAPVIDNAAAAVYSKALHAEPHCLDSKCAPDFRESMLAAAAAAIIAVAEHDARAIEPAQGAAA